MKNNEEICEIFNEMRVTGHSLCRNKAKKCENCPQRHEKIIRCDQQQQQQQQQQQ